VRRSAFEALLERGRIVPAAEPEQSPAQAFWEGELLPVPTVDVAEGVDAPSPPRQTGVARRCATLLFGLGEQRRELVERLLPARGCTPAAGATSGSTQAT
jgi:hypothetical protein